ncbi:MAG: hypothetical protein ABWK01_02180 [Infirmifilum sp.]
MEELVKELSALGLRAEPVVDFIKTLYAAQEVPYEREDKEAGHRLVELPDGTRLLTYPAEELYHVDELVVKVLKNYDLISAWTHYGSHANVRFYGLTEKGLQLGSQAYRESLELAAGRLAGVLGEYPRGLAKVLALSATDPRSGRFTWLSVKVGAQEYKIDLPDYTTRLLKPEELRRIREAQYGVSRELYGDLRLVNEELERVARTRLYEPRNYDMFMSVFLLECGGRVYKEALRLMEDLAGLGLAVRVPLFDSKGDRSGDEYRAPPEMAHVLSERSAGVDFGEAMRRFFMIEMVLRALRGKVVREELLAASQGLGIPEAEVKTALELMHQMGLTSKYNEGGAPDSPAFIVLDEGGLREEVVRAVKQLEALVLQ